jgi:DNA-binding MarR family transcriptional regulator
VDIVPILAIWGSRCSFGASHAGDPDNYAPQDLAKYHAEYLSFFTDSILSEMIHFHTVYFQTEILMNKNNLSGNTETRKDITDILLRLFYLRRRLLRGKLPEQILNVKTSIQEHNLREKIGQINDRDVFFSIGFVFSRQSEPITMGDLSRILGVPFSTSTRTADWLVNNGYVQRLADPGDRRVVRVELTEIGKELYRAMDDLLLESAEQFLHNFSLEERKELGRLLGKLVDNLEQDPM